MHHLTDSAWWGNLLLSFAAVFFRFLLRYFSTFPLFFNSLYFSARSSFFSTAAVEITDNDYNADIYYT